MQKKTKIIIISTILLLITISIIILLTKNVNKQIPQQLTEQAKAQYETIIGNQSYDITNSVLEPNEITPAISAGMIPIKWNGTNFIITTKDDWCDYSNGQPAYIMLNDGYYKSEIEQGVTNEQLMENNVGVGVPDDPSTRGTIYMWIPRFAYNAQDEILYIKQSHSVAGTYTMPEIFTYQTEKRDLSLAGIWVECNPLANTSAVNTKISNMQGPNNQYGFIANTIGTNANNETSYKTTIETYINKLTANVVGATSVRNTQKNLPNVARTPEEYPSTVENDAHDDPQITDISNTNRTILKITNSNQIEPIKGKAYYDETEEKIKIEITYRTNAITQILDSKGKILSENSTTADTGEEIIGNKTYKYIIIDNIGNIKEITTKVEGLKIYVIPDLETLKQFRDEVNAGNTFSGITVIQTADIAMNEGKYTIDEQTGDVIFDEEKEPEQWTPIGDYATSNKTFAGVYNGQGYTISGIYINTNSSYQGLFGGMTNGKIQNLGIKESYIQGRYYVGGFVGTASLSTKTIITIENCYNEGTVVGAVSWGSQIYVGGICGVGNVNIINCYNTGNIKGDSCVGGITGGNNGGKIENCYNIGTICTLNKTNTYGPGNIGGIIGKCDSYYGVEIRNCYNAGNIIGLENSNYIGGISGTRYGVIENCYNVGNILGNGNVGGIAGTNNSKNIGSCYNIGKVSGNTYIGGICGNSNSGIKNCYNTGFVSGTNYIGGISGSTESIESCYNVGFVSGKSSVGGITGACSKTISNTYYLEGTATYGFESGKNNTNAEPKTEAEIKELTTVLNGEVEPENAIWVEDTLGINSGYPIFAWQLETIE